MKNSIKGLLRTIASRFNMNLINNYELNQDRIYKDILQKLYQSSTITETSNGLEIIIFSKDRPIQLHALLTSYIQFASPLMPVQVLYYASGEAESRAYDELKILTAEYEISFCKETNFRIDLIKTLQRVKASKLFFMVDDMFFKSSVDLSKFAIIDTRQYVPSLRMGKHLSYSYTTQKNQELPTFTEGNYPGMLSWDWSQGKLDWNYPLSVDGHLFDTKEITTIISNLDFKAPNSLEAALQVMQPLFVTRKGLCFNKSIVINNPCNKVQVENENIAGDYSAKQLLKSWQEGMAIDYSQASEMQNTSAHQEIALKFKMR